MKNNHIEESKNVSRAYFAFVSVDSNIVDRLLPDTYRISLSYFEISLLQHLLLFFEPSIISHFTNNRFLPIREIFVSCSCTWVLMSPIFLFKLNCLYLKKTHVQYRLLINWINIFLWNVRHVVLFWELLIIMMLDRHFRCSVEKFKTWNNLEVQCVVLWRSMIFRNVLFNLKTTRHHYRWQPYVHSFFHWPIYSDALLFLIC